MTERDQQGLPLKLANPGSTTEYWRMAGIWVAFRFESRLGLGFFFSLGDLTAVQSPFHSQPRVHMALGQARS